MAAGSIPIVLPRINNKQLEQKKYLNLLLTLLARRNNMPIVRSMPFEVTIDPSTICQLSCPCCSMGTGTMHRTKAVLHPPLHQQIIECLGEYLFIVWYFSTGEPLLNRFLPDIVASTHRNDIYSIISTNLSLKLSDARIEQLLTCGLGCISVSLDGATADVYRRYRVGGDFALVIDNLRRLVKRKRELGLSLPYIEWRFLVFRHNAHEVELSRLMATDIGVDLLEFFYGCAPPDAKDDTIQLAWPMDLAPAVSGPALEHASLRPKTAMLKALSSTSFNYPALSRLFKVARDGIKRLNWSRRLRLPDVSFASPMATQINSKCDWLYFGSTVFPNGSVGPCCLSNEEIDDFGKLSMDHNFSTVWNNSSYQEARLLGKNNNWQQTQLVCARCPETKARNYQFATTLQALLRNAPDWFIHIIAAAPAQFFYPIDEQLSPLEFAALPRCWEFLSVKDFAAVGQWLLSEAKHQTPEVAKQIYWLHGLLLTYTFKAADAIE